MQSSQILQNVHDAVFLIAPDGVVRTWNAGAARVYGYSESEMVGSNVRLLFPAYDQERFTSRVYPGVQKDMTFEFTARSLRKGGEWIVVAVRASLFTGMEGAEQVLICANDVTRQRQLEKRMLQISELEQRRIGQDIHDDLCQELAAMGCLFKVLEKEVSHHCPECGEKARKLGHMLSETSTRAREISRGLVPLVVESEGLEGALDELARTTSEIYGIDCVLTQNGSFPALPSESAVQLYRIGQEAVANSVKHGKAGMIRITLCDDGMLRLRIEDNGRGMQGGNDGRSGLGLQGMLHRADYLGGGLEIKPGESRGTVVEVWVPRVHTLGELQNG